MLVTILLDEAILPLNRTSISLNGLTIRFQNDSFVQALSFDTSEMAKAAFKLISSDIQNLGRSFSSNSCGSLNFTKEELKAKLNTEAALGM